MLQQSIWIDAICEALEARRIRLLRKLTWGNSRRGGDSRSVPHLQQDEFEPDIESDEFGICLGDTNASMPVNVNNNRSVDLTFGPDQDAEATSFVKAPPIPKGPTKNLKDVVDFDIHRGYCLRENFERFLEGRVRLS